MALSETSKDVVGHASPTALRALIADDTDVFRFALASLLVAQLGFREVVEASSLDEALACLGAAEEAFGLVLLDLKMPGMKDATSVAAVRECFPEAIVAIITASRLRSDVLTALSAGAHGYLWKETALAELVESIRSLLAGKVVVPDWLPNVEEDDARALNTAPEISVTDPRVLDNLTPRQREVLTYLVGGLSNKEIARSMHLAEGTIKIHVAALLRAFNTSHRAGAAAVGGRLMASGQLRREERPAE